jgi:NADPH2:quinone reductase
MRAAVLVKNGSSEKAFEIRELPDPQPGKEQVLIRVEAFGLNFADVMARLGIYQDCPPLPAVIGYDVAGIVESVGEGVTDVKTGDRVLALTRFGGYAELVVTDFRGVAKIPESIDSNTATALSTQYGTAWYCAEECGSLNAEDHVLVHAAAGGVGTALVQLAKMHGCTVYGTAGSDEKMKYLRQLGVDHPINYREEDFVTAIRKIAGTSGLDVIFDPIGGDSVKKGIKLLRQGGRIICFGGAQRTGRPNLLKTLSFAWGFGIYSPVEFLMRSQGVIGVNMLRIADHRPWVLKKCLDEVVSLTETGKLNPHIGGIFPVEELAKAHALLESRASVGKLVVRWK